MEQENQNIKIEIGDKPNLIKPELTI